jgi:Raf kinase inhibitor-like YbhB/YbcL family protein
MPIQVEIEKIREGEQIPTKFTCDGENVSPEIRIGKIPEGTKSLALVVEDPDAPVGLFVHWVLYNIDPSRPVIHGGVEKKNQTVEGFRQGKNDFGRIGYDGPCPPKGHGYHRYFFRVFALRDVPTVRGEVKRETLLRAMEGLIIDKGETMGRYQR